MSDRFPPGGAFPERGRRPTAAEIGTAALHRFRANLTPDKLCGARKRSTGEPCRNVPAKGRKRCRLHGGATPKGDGLAGWHTPGFPTGLPTETPKAAAVKAARREKQRERVAAMTPEERARYDEWRRTHRPGSKTARAQGRQNREAQRWLASLSEDAGTAPSPELAELREVRAKLSAEIARLEAEGAETQTPNVDEPAGGLFD